MLSLLLRREEQAKVLFKVNKQQPCQRVLMHGRCQIIDSSRDGSISQFEMLHFFVADLDSKDEAKRVSAIVNEMMRSHALPLMSSRIASMWTVILREYGCLCSKVEDVAAGGLTLQLFTLKVVAPYICLLTCSGISN